MLKQLVAGVSDSLNHYATDRHLAIILGGGAGFRLFPLTATRSKPAVPIGGKYRLIDVPISGCLHADIRRIFVLTQFNSASLNRHISSTYRLDRFSGGFVEILAAEQTPDNPNWYQGTADAVRRRCATSRQHDADYDLILAGDHLYRMDYAELVDAHKRSGADITIAAQPVDLETATQMGIFRSIATAHRRVRGKAQARAPRGRSAAASRRARRLPTHSDEQPFMASMGIYVFTRRVLLDMLEHEPGHDFGRELIPNALGPLQGAAVSVPRLLGRRRHDRIVLRDERHARPADAPFRFWDRSGRSTRTCGTCRLADDRLPRRDSIVGEGCYLDGLRDRQFGRRRAHARRRGRARHAIGPARRRLLRRRRAAEHPPPLGIGRDVVLDRVIIDKNARIGDGARLVNEQNLEDADGDGYYIRSGIIVVPKAESSDQEPVV